MNLNHLRIPEEHLPNNECRPLRDLSVKGANGVRVYFKNMAQNLIEEMRDAPIIVGCVAWLTCPVILSAMASKEVSIIVQKEDFLRPDTGQELRSASSSVRRSYGLLTGLDRRALGYESLYGGMSMCSGSPEKDPPVRCVGVRNARKALAAPRAHHKFVVMCRMAEVAPQTHRVRPFRVWTGSFNFTRNAGNSFENAVVIEDAEIVQAYFDEYQQVAALSEPLDWTSEWVEPEFRIGT